MGHRPAAPRCRSRGWLLCAAVGVVARRAPRECGVVVRTRLTRFGSLLVLAGAESLAIFTAGVLTPDRGLGGIFAALWAIPLAVALEVVALSRIREAQDSAALQHLMRDAVARLSNA